VQDRDDASGRQAVRGQVFQGVDVAEFRPLADEFGHVGTFWVKRVRVVDNKPLDSIATQQTDVSISATVFYKTLKAAFCQFKSLW
jgi:hypothetical protein